MSEYPEVYTTMIDPLIVLILSASIGLLYFMAARHKMAEPTRFKATLAAYQVLPAPLVPAVARGIPYLEMAIVFLILIPATREPAALTAGALFLIYAAAMAVNLGRGRTDIDCGCGGQPQLLSPWLLLRNLILAAASFVLLFPGSDRSLVWTDLFFLVLMTAVLALVYMMVEQLVRNNSSFENGSSSNG